MNIVSFIMQLMPALTQFAKWLYARHNGDVKAATAELQKMPDEWTSLKADRAEIDQQLAALRKGK